MYIPSPQLYGLIWYKIVVKKIDEAAEGQMLVKVKV